MVLEPTKTLEALLDGAPATNQLPWVTSWGDLTATAIVPDGDDGVTNGVTAVTIVPAPGADTKRQIRNITIYNADTASRIVTVRLNNNGTTRQMVKATLAPGDSLVYEWGRGWFRVPSAFERGTGAFDDGSAAAPSITFVQDPDTGLYRSVADTLAFATAGVKRVEFNATDFVLSSGIRASYAGANRFRYLQSMVRVQLTSNQSIASGTPTALANFGVVFNTDGLWVVGQPTRLTVAISGKYIIAGGVIWESGGTDAAYHELQIRFNGAAHIAAHIWHRAYAWDSVAMTVSTLYDPAAGNFFELMVRQDTGAPKNVLADARSFFSMVYVGE